MDLLAPTPIFRMFDEAKTREFYVRWLGFRVQFEHRYEPDMPLYMAIERGNCILHLSEHHGDTTPGSAIRIEVSDVDELHRELSSRPYGFARPSVEPRPWGTREISLTDPSGNRLHFFSRC